MYTIKDNSIISRNPYGNRLSFIRSNGRVLKKIFKAVLVSYYQLRVEESTDTQSAGLLLLCCVWFSFVPQHFTQASKQRKKRHIDNTRWKVLWESCRKV